MSERDSAPRLIVPFDELPHSKDSHRFAGEEHGELPFSAILIHTRAGAGPELHVHPYPEAWIVEEGEAMFVVGDRRAVVTAGHVVIGPPNVPHAFTNTGQEILRMVSIHGSPRFVTDYVVRDEPKETAGG